MSVARRIASVAAAFAFGIAAVPAAAAVVDATTARSVQAGTDGAGWGVAPASVTTAGAGWGSPSPATAI